ncbi:PilT/PilU family type 4a pilus ATPase [Candidatus Gracilibacteria bacterium]|nr:PilT/PilU family type 4a pilus ATPase [Candidatus Gracilibacteria bacterium]
MELQNFLTLIDEIIENKISDLHLTPEDYPYIRSAIGEIEPLEKYGKLLNDDIIDICKILVSRPITEKTLDLSFEYHGTRFRVNISHVIRGYCISFRSIPAVIPNAETIMLPEYLLNITNSEKGIILITGPTGSGKSTTMATMLDYVNKTMKRHIITLEDPIEFVYKNNLSLIHQRELGKHFDSFANGIKSILREDPDVIVIGEMRDLETMEAAIALAETGHLVFSTLHTNDTVQTIDRVLQSFSSDKQNQIRMQFGLAMRAIISQILLPKKDGTGRVVAREIMFNNDSIRNLIIRGDTQHMYSVLETSRQDGMLLMDDALLGLYKRGHIAPSTVEFNIRDKSRMNSIVNNSK